MKKVLLIIFLALFAFACTSSSGGSNKAVLKLTFDPSSVSLSADGRYHYTITLRETAGIGVTITSYNAIAYRPNGQFAFDDSFTANDFANWFTDCDGGGTYIAGGMTRCTGVWTRIAGGGYADWTFMGSDDRGNTVSVTERITYQ